MVQRSVLPIPSIKPVAWFHAYVLCGVIGIRWGKYAPSYANGNPKLYSILREYLTYACGEDEWTKGRILEAMRFKTGTAIKADARVAFPSLFPRNRKARSLGVPEELNDIESVFFDPKRIERWRKRVRRVKKEISEMSENATAPETTEATPVDRSSAPSSGSNSRVTVNFFIPENVDATSLTLENYREVTGKRFRMTKDQAKVRGLSRESAFAESKALAISQLGGN